MSRHRDREQSGGPPPQGHSHFWERVLSRRRFMGTSAQIGIAVASSAFWMPSLIGGTFGSGTPKPIPATTSLPFGNFHFFFPGAGAEPSLITDFDGFVGVADIKGGTGKGPGGAPFRWNADNRFMKGTYKADDGTTREGAFAFV